MAIGVDSTMTKAQVSLPNVSLGSRDGFRFYGWVLQTLDCDWFVVEIELNGFVVPIQLHRAVYLQPVIS
jgi:hypothetical protein